MKLDNLRKYITLRDSLVREKQQLEQRLAEINKALGTSLPTGTVTAQPSQPEPPARRGRGRRNGSSLRETVLQVLADGPLTKEEILNKVKASGYRFETNNPLNSLGVILYGKNPKFRNENGRFSVSNRSAGPAATTRTAERSGPFGRKRPQLSAEARERIAAAQRERWAKARRSK